MSPVVGRSPAAVRAPRSAATAFSTSAALFGAFAAPVTLGSRQTNTVSRMDERVPRMWMEPLISAGQGIAAVQVSPASRIATPMAAYTSSRLWWKVKASGAPTFMAVAIRRNTCASPSV